MLIAKEHTGRKCEKLLAQRNCVVTLKQFVCTHNEPAAEGEGFHRVTSRFRHSPS